MSVNGHDHLDNFEVIDNVCYFDVNACRFGYWWYQDEHHYLKENTFMFTDYDKDGNKLTFGIKYLVNKNYTNVATNAGVYVAAIETVDDNFVIVGFRENEYGKI